MPVHAGSDSCENTLRYGRSDLKLYGQFHVLETLLGEQLRAVQRALSLSLRYLVPQMVCDAFPSGAAGVAREVMPRAGKGGGGVKFPAENGSCRWPQLNLWLCRLRAFEALRASRPHI